MSAPVDDDESSEHRKYAPKRFREQPRIPAGSQFGVTSPPVSPPHAQLQNERGETSGLHPFQGNLENDAPRQEYEPERISQIRRQGSRIPATSELRATSPLGSRSYEPEPLSEPQRQHRGYYWFTIAAGCTALIVIIGAITKPLWQGSNERDAEPPGASRLSDRPVANKAPADTVTGIAAVSGAQQPINMQAELPRLTPPGGQFEQKSIGSPVQGVTENEIQFGISAPFSGAAKELGQNMKLGIDAAFNVANTNGGVHGRQLRLVAVDDGYEPTRTAETMKQLYEQDRVFGIVGNVGTPTAVVALPYALERQMLFYGAFTGASLLRRDPPDRYVFNYRASYAEETDAVVRYLVKVRRLKPEQIAVFAQQDSYGDAGFAGVAKAIRSLQGGDESTILRLNYKRNTVDVDDAIAQLKKSHVPIKAVIMVPTYRAAARFIEKTRDLYPSMIYTSVSFVGSTALASELMLLGQKYATRVIVTQVVPAVDGHSSVVLDYKSALAKYFPRESPDYVSLEGYLAGTVLVEALKRNGPQVDTERLVDTLENLRDFDMGLGTPVTFGRTEHQALHKVWGTQLDATGHYQAIDLQ
jgi:branched-chain amino acid transport system substrate-binding protein